MTDEKQEEKKEEIEEEVKEESKTEEKPTEEVKEDVAPVAEDPKEEVKKDEPVKEIEMTADQKKVIDMIEKMTVLELHALVKVFEEKFGVSATAVAATAGVVAGGDAGEEKSDFIVHLTSFGEKKIAVIKVIKEVLGLGLKEAKDMAESAPVDLKSGVKKEEAEEWKGKFEEAGASVELK